MDHLSEAPAPPCATWALTAASAAASSAKLPLIAPIAAAVLATILSMFASYGAMLIVAPACRITSSSAIYDIPLYFPVRIIHDSLTVVALGSFSMVPDLCYPSLRLLFLGPAYRVAQVLRYLVGTRTHVDPGELKLLARLCLGNLLPRLSTTRSFIPGRSPTLT